METEKLNRSRENPRGLITTDRSAHAAYQEQKRRRREQASLEARIAELEKTVAALQRTLAELMQ